jgi:hypothetical protein
MEDGVLTGEFAALQIVNVNQVIALGANYGGIYSDLTLSMGTARKACSATRPAAVSRSNRL